MLNTERLLLASADLIEEQERDLAQLRDAKLSVELKASVAMRVLSRTIQLLEQRMTAQEKALADLRTQVSDLSYNLPV